MSALVQLDAAEVAQLTRFEERIQQGLASFIEVGEALSAIRERRLYRATHGTFEDYCREKWGMSRIRAHHMQAEVKRELTLRARAYKKWVAAGTMTQGDADRAQARLKACGELLGEIAACSATKLELQALGRNREIQT